MPRHHPESPVSIVFGAVTAVRHPRSKIYLNATLPKAVMGRIAHGDDLTTYYTGVTGAGANADFVVIAGRERADTTDRYMRSAKSVRVPSYFLRDRDTAPGSLPTAYVMVEGRDEVIAAHVDDLATRLGSAILSSQGLSTEAFGSAVLLASFAPKPIIAAGLADSMGSLITPGTINRAFPELAGLNPPVVFAA